MKILNISKTLMGGAGIATLRIHNYFIENNIDSHLITSENNNFLDKKIENLQIINGNEGVVFKILRNLKKKMKFFQRLLIRINPYCFYSFCELKKKKQKLNFTKEIDVILVHWCDNFINLKNILFLKKKYKCEVIFIMYDTFLLTGGCHYNNNCEMFKKDCSSCPAVPFFKYKVSKQFKIKRETLKEINGTILFLSKQDEILINASQAYFKNKFHVNIPIDKKIFLSSFDYVKKNDEIKIFSSVNKYDLRKGYNDFKVFLEKIDKVLKFKLTFFYMDDAEIFKKKFKFISFKKINFAKTERELSNIYKNADFFFNFSKSDSAPQMINEALLSGKPVISSKIGNAPDLIKHEENGLLLDDFKSNNNINSIIEFITNFKNKRIFFFENEKSDIIEVIKHAIKQH